VRALLGAVVKVNYGGVTPLHMSVVNGHTATCRLLLERGADRGARSTGVYCGFPAGSTPADVAAKKGRAECAQLLRG
jgi:ankyrin repeat protein